MGIRSIALVTLMPIIQPTLLSYMILLNLSVKGLPMPICPLVILGGYTTVLRAFNCVCRSFPSSYLPLSLVLFSRLVLF